MKISVLSLGGRPHGRPGCRNVKSAGDGAGELTTIAGPDGQQTMVTLNANDYVAELANPNGEARASPIATEISSQWAWMRVTHCHATAMPKMAAW